MSADAHQVAEQLVREWSFDTEALAGCHLEQSDKPCDCQRLADLITTALAAATAQGRAQGLEEAAQSLESTTGDDLRLHAGELSGAEVRMFQTLLKVYANKIRAAATTRRGEGTP